MTPPKYWPQHAENARMDAIALTLDIDMTEELLPCEEWQSISGYEDYYILDCS